MEYNSKIGLYFLDCPMDSDTRDIYFNFCRRLKEPRESKDRREKYKGCKCKGYVNIYPYGLIDLPPQKLPIELIGVGNQIETCIGKVDEKILEIIKEDILKGMLAITYISRTNPSIKL